MNLRTGNFNSECYYIDMNHSEESVRRGNNLKGYYGSETPNRKILRNIFGIRGFGDLTLDCVKFYPYNSCDDYFFPYRHISEGELYNGMGYCEVPLQNLPNYGLVSTAPMNGCALEVRWNNNSQRFVFIHDKNGRSLPPCSSNESCICRITANYYYGFTNQQMDLFRVQGIFPFFQFICVFINGFWEVGCWGICFNDRNEQFAFMTPCQNGNFQNTFYEGKFNQYSLLIRE